MGGLDTPLEERPPLPRWPRQHLAEQQGGRCRSAAFDVGPVRYGTLRQTEDVGQRGPGQPDRFTSFPEQFFFWGHGGLRWFFHSLIGIASGVVYAWPGPVGTG